MTGADIRENFIKFFEGKGHRSVASSSLLPQADKTLLFTNAGMVQFKSVFTGEDSRDYVRATSSQKCVRAGGKHNDLENVGQTARHHTFFEMLGNFSFGDYFKKEAICWAWEFLTVTCGLPEDRLWITIFRDDDEAFKIWKDTIGVPDHRIVRMGEASNFWSMGDTGPCGPCSEIHIDQGSGIGCKRAECDINCDCDRFLEIWNLVFMQFERREDGTMIPLPKPSIDTGMGLERLAAVMQGKESNYDTDLIYPIITRLEEESGRKYLPSSREGTAMRVIADHIRALTFLISDGILPGNEGRGYVLRRILRRAKRYQEFLGIDGEFLYRLSEVVESIMGKAYPELLQKRELISRIIRIEEEKFTQTLKRGRSLVSELITGLRDKNCTVLPGSDAFRLYDTYGFPLDMSREIFATSGISLDEEGFQAHMVQQKNLGQSSWKKEGSSSGMRDWMKGLAETVFTGYESTITTDAVILGCDSEILVLDRSPFYGESGGQIGDTGMIHGPGVQLQITGTLKCEGLFLHYYDIIEGRPEAGMIVKAEVDLERRLAIMRNHTGTHLLQGALRSVLGSHVQQSGSYVDNQRLRFDFKHFTQMTREELDAVESLVNQKIWDMLPVSAESKPVEEARKDGALAFFDEKYGQTVRVISISDFSKEFCGGTHLKNTGTIGLFRIVTETGVAASVRRIEAVTGLNAWHSIKKDELVLADIAARLKAQQQDALPGRIDALLQEKKELERQIEEYRIKIASSNLDGLISRSVNIGTARIVVSELPGVNISELRNMADRVTDKIKSGVAILGTSEEGKAALVVKVTDDLTGRVKAGDLIREIAPIVGGSGGGKPALAQAGGKEPGKIGQALARGLEIASSRLK
ncbi:MAG: alanine--tRNA ligase [Candidatus Wallbacteria bacterium]|nr:alanine--tRNA ligase [Candidatus Wallbacteria bacterium]